MTPRADHEFSPLADVSALRIARVYAEALMQAADRHAQADAMAEALDSLALDVFRADGRIEAFLASPAVPKKAKAAVIKEVFGSRSGQLFANFLLVLNDHGRLGLLRYVRAAYLELLDRRASRVRVQVQSARPLAPDQRQRLQEELHTTLKLEPILKEQVDPELIGGMTVRVGDWLYDASLRTQLEDLRNQILTRSSHEIQRRGDSFGTDAGN
jgi:F-type H+-transporting ATPase subunit delta